MVSSQRKINFRDLVPKYPLDAVRKDQNLMLLGPAYVCEYLHVPDSVYREVYEPSEDTFLLIDALHVDLPELLANNNSIENVIEIG